jgi:hypothetical protein
MDYFCKQCGAVVNQTESGLVRTCEHVGTIIVGMSATCYGEGGAASSGCSVDRVKAVFLRLCRKVFGG